VIILSLGVFYFIYKSKPFDPQASTLKIFVRILNVIDEFVKILIIANILTHKDLALSQALPKSCFLLYSALQVPLGPLIRKKK
jgi:Na+/H+ antiporter NhaA